MALTKFCPVRGCNNIIPISERYCADHIHLIIEQEAERQSHYDKKVRHGKDAQLTAFYHSGEWDAKRQYIIAKYKGVDVYAYYTLHQIVPATTVHHIKPLRKAWELRLADSNLIPISAQSHAEIESLYRTQEAKTQTLLSGLIFRWEQELGTHPGG